MNDLVLLWMVEYGTPLIGLGVFLGCFGIPLPSSLSIVVGASMAMTGELALFPIVAVSLLAAIAGDQFGYLIGKLSNNLMSGSSGTTQAVMRRAQKYLDKNGIKAVFFSRWLLSPLGPPINLLAGGATMSWLDFTVASLTGEMVWVALYASAGIMFGQYIPEIVEYSSSITAVLAALAVMFVLGKYLFKIKRP